MPGPAETLDGLRRIANDVVWLAIAWHAAIVVALAFARGGWRPRKPWAALMLAGPLVSASVLAWIDANPFNGTVLGLVAVATVGIGLSLPREPVEAGARWAWWIGVAMVLFGAVYPHFLETATVRSYLIAAPTGLIPCPSLSLVIGFGLMADGLGSRAWSFVLAAAGLFYGLFGVLRLGVYLDVGLLIGAVALAVQGFVLHARGHRAPVPAERAA
ncbi:MAG: hypothetical protein ACOCUS_05835 [Polyangiales bacterium]